MEKSPPSDEAMAEVAEVIARVMTRPGETILGIAAFVLVDPKGQLRSLVHPGDMTEELLKYIAGEIPKRFP